jgi:hypothetical protein
MRFSSLSKLAAVTVVVAGALVASSTIAGAGGLTLTFDPDPVRAGDTVNITLAGTWSECNNQELAPSFIHILVPGQPDIEGSFPGGNTTGTVTIPAELAPGTYDMQIQCSFSVGNSTYFPDLQIEILAALPPTTSSTEPSTSSTSASTSSSSVAAAAQTTSPRFTG